MTGAEAAGAPAVVVTTVRVALVLYAAGGATWAVSGWRDAGPAWSRATRVLHTLALVAYLAHVAAAFQLVHGWSHARAEAETARQTAELFGVDSGAGLWLNYLFTLVWSADVAWWWLDAEGHRRRRRWISIAVHGFLVFLFFNGAVVFAEGFSRIFGVAALVLVCALWIGRALSIGRVASQTTRRRSGSRDQDPADDQTSKSKRESEDPIGR